MSASIAARITAEFPPHDHEAVRAALATYGEAEHEREAERVHGAILDLADNNADRVLLLVKNAKDDYRDVLFWASS
ncbi:MAG: hypothetical protein H0W83_07050 [Planctomycetes bacterium]|nr:hypothetical protein [Planctomycetota bacterium]